MRRSLAVVLLVTLLAAGCTARGAKQDPFAYAKKPLYVDHFDVTALRTHADARSFRVEDGSIAHVNAQAWVNVTAGQARLDLIDPTGRIVWSTTTTGSTTAMTDLGTWTVRVTGLADPATGEPAGSVDVVVTR